jgi:hypothetical protein
MPCIVDVRDVEIWWVIISTDLGVATIAGSILRCSKWTTPGYTMHGVDLRYVLAS